MRRVTKCLLRPNAPCGRNLAATKGLCFIAVPSSQEFNSDLMEISRVLEMEGITAYVAVLDPQPGIEIFCEKICSKIIEAELCAVVLNDVLDEASSKRFPNANVYFEYGLMVGLGKTILPLQRKGLPLPFDVNHIEVVKHELGELAANLGPLMAQARSVARGGRHSKSLIHTAGLKRLFAARLAKALELAGFREVSPASVKLRTTDDIGYVLYQRNSGHLLYATACEGTSDLKDLLINTKLLLRRVEETYVDVKAKTRMFTRQGYGKLLREWEDALLTIDRVGIVVGISGTDSPKVLQELNSAVLACKVSFRIEKLEVWGQAKVELIEKSSPQIRQ